jgi:hypothetical protein
MLGMADVETAALAGEEAFCAIYASINAFKSSLLPAVAEVAHSANAMLDTKILVFLLRMKLFMVFSLAHHCSEFLCNNPM